MRRFFPPAALFLAVVLFFPRPAHCAAPGGDGAPPPSGFADSFFASALERHSVPGAAVAIILPGREPFVRGYGFRDASAKDPVDAASTLFRVASITKLFTATAAMKLVEEGRLSPDGTVEDYLRGFPRDGFAPGKVAIRDLLTHTSGLDPKFIAANYGVRTPSKPDSAYLRGLVSNFAPGPSASRKKKFEYANSNYEMTLLALVIEDASNADFFEYIDDNIFKKLNISAPVFFPGEAERSRMAKGYEGAKGRRREVPFSYYNNPPASGLFSTAADMALFLSDNIAAHGSAECRVLKRETYLAMHSTAFDSGKRDEKMAFGFREASVAGRRALWHTGTLRGYASALYVFPDDGAGFFLVYNVGEADLRDGFLKAFARAYLR